MGTKDVARLRPRPQAPLRWTVRRLYLASGSTTKPQHGGDTMSWATPTLVEICVGLEINGYLPAEF